MDVRNSGRFEVEDDYRVIRAEDKLTIKTPYNYLEATISNGIVLENFFAYLAAPYWAKKDPELRLYEKAIQELKGFLLKYPMSFSGENVYFHDVNKNGGLASIAYFKASYFTHFLGEICVIADTIADTSVLMSIRALNRYYGYNVVDLLISIAKKRQIKPLSDAQKQRAIATLASTAFDSEIDGAVVDRLKNVYRYIKYTA